MAILNLNPARLDIELPVGDAFEQRFTFQENVSGGVSAKLYDRQGNFLQDFTVSEISSTAEETVVVISLPDTSEKVNGRWEVVSTSAKFKTKIQGDFKIADADGSQRPSNDQSILISESDQSVVVEFQGTPGPRGLSTDWRAEGEWLQYSPEGLNQWTNAIRLEELYTGFTRILGTLGDVTDLPSTADTGDAYLIPNAQGVDEIHVWVSTSFINVGPFRGEDGRDGIDAYQDWLDEGNTGTRSDFINDLRIRHKQQDTPPDNPIDGDFWTDTSTGNEYVYLSGQWVEFGNTGLIPVEWKGVYDPTDTYTKDQRVSYEGSSFISLQNGNTGNTPVGNEADTWWDVIAEKGVDGADGADGTNGVDGADGVDGDSAFVYIAYADDDTGTGFTTTFNASKDYIAVNSTDTEIATPTASDFTGLWKNYKGAKGDTGWTPVFAVVTDGARRVLQVLDWTGGDGTKPAVGQYVGATGLVALIADAIDIRGEGLGTHETSVGNHTDVDLTGAQDGDLLQRESGIWVKKNKVDSLSRLFANYPQQRQVAWDTFNRPNGALGTSDSGHAYTVNAGNPEILDKIARMTNEADVHIHVPHLASIINGTTRKRVVDATISAFSVSSISVGLWMGVDKDNRIEAYSTQSTLEIKKVINGVRSTVSTISTNSNDVRYSFGRITFNLHVIGFRETMRAFLIDRDRGVTLGNVVLDEHFALFSDFPLIGFIGTTSSASNTPVANFNAYDLA